jgi:hypothetical protein
MTPSRALPLDGEVFSLLGSPPEAIGMCGGAMIQTQSLSICRCTPSGRSPTALTDGRGER